MKRKLFVLACLLSITLLLSTCNFSPENRAGKWQATSEFGDFSFVIDETGSMITHIEYDLTCEEGGLSSSLDMSGGPGSDLEDGKINLKILMLGSIPMVEWEGKFNSSGTKASGTLWMIQGNCETKWSAEKVD